MWFDFDEVLAPVAEATGVTSRSFAEEPGNAGVDPYIGIIVFGAEPNTVAGLQISDVTSYLSASPLSCVASVSPLLVELTGHRHIGEPACRTVIGIRPHGIIHHLPQQHAVFPANQADSEPAKNRTIFPGCFHLGVPHASDQPVLQNTSRECVAVRIEVFQQQLGLFLPCRRLRTVVTAPAHRCLLSSQNRRCESGAQRYPVRSSAPRLSLWNTRGCWC